MKLLFDQNISFRILKILSNTYPNSNQVKALGLENTSDIDIWKYAKANHYTIVTFDSDFSNISKLNGHPPKIIWLRTGNTSTKNIADILIKSAENIKTFISSKELENIACLELID